MTAQHNKIAYVTGSSRGIGKALVHQLLKDGYFVIGMSRNNEIEDANFRFDRLDLNDIQGVKAYDFNLSASEILIVNNAGAIGDINPVGTVNDDSIEQVINVNTVAPQILMNRFISTFKSHEGKFHIVNISSGAGKKAISSWAAYCASKAAIDLFSETVASEFEWKQMTNWRIHSCAPGVVDTQMQVEIRSTDKSAFAHVDNFKAYKENKELFTTEYVAEKLMYLIKNPHEFWDVVVSVRDF